MKSKYVRPCVISSDRGVENAVPLAMAALVTGVASGVLLGAQARRVFGGAIYNHPGSQKLSE